MNERDPISLRKFLEFTNNGSPGFTLPAGPSQSTVTLTGAVWAFGTDGRINIFYSSVLAGSDATDNTSVAFDQIQIRVNVFASADGSGNRIGQFFLATGGNATQAGTPGVAISAPFRGFDPILSLTSKLSGNPMSIQFVATLSARNLLAPVKHVTLQMCNVIEIEHFGPTRLI